MNWFTNYGTAAVIQLNTATQYRTQVGGTIWIGDLPAQNTQWQHLAATPPKWKCEYCGRKNSIERDDCKSCGAVGR